MKLVADSRGRLTAADLFRPNAAFDATRQPDGSIRVMELAEREVPLIRPRRVKGRLRIVGIKPSREAIAAAVRADRDEQ